MSFRSRLFAYVAAVVAAGAHAGNEGVKLEYSASSFPVESPAHEAFAFWERFTFAFDRSADEVFADRLHPFNSMNWSMGLAEHDSISLREQPSRAAREALAQSFVSGLREAAADLSLVTWLEERQSWLADFLVNSVDSVEEEALAPTGLSYRVLERSWWKRVSDSGRTRYGIRPFRADPYAFVSFGLKDGGTPFLLAHVRYYYDQLSDHRFEFAMSVPLSCGFSIDLGTSYQLGGLNDEKRAVLKVFKQFRSGGILHVGFEAREHSALLAGMSLPW